MGDKQPIDDLPQKEVYAQLFAILSNRRRNIDDQLVIGYAQEDLSKVLNTPLEETEELIQEFNAYLLGLGLSVVEFMYNKQTWYCIKSLYAAPIELSEEELGVLGGLIMLAEEKNQEYIEQAKLLEYFITREYFNEHRLRRTITRLIQNAYIEKQSGGKLAYGPRTLIEINNESRRKIAKQAADLLF